MHHLITAGVTVESALDSVDLALNAAHARQQLAPSLDGMCHLQKIG
jgi:hypothetical protein